VASNADRIRRAVRTTEPRNHPSFTPHPKRILIVRLSAIGDCLDLVPVAVALTKAMPKTEIHWLTEDRVAPLLGRVRDLTAVHAVPRKSWRPLFKNPLKWGRLGSHLSSFLTPLRKLNFDWVLDLHGNFKSGMWARAVRGRWTAGLPRTESRELNHLFLNSEIDFADAGRNADGSRPIHRTERAFRVLDRLGVPRIPLDDCAANWDFPAEARVSLKRKLGATGDNKRPLIVVNVGMSAAGRFKRWPLERFGHLARSMASGQSGLQNPRVLILWGPGEERDAREVVGVAGHGVEMAPPTDLDELAWLLRMTQLFLGCDSGPMHLAGLLGTPCVAIFGPKLAATYGPRSKVSRTVEDATVACRPCRDKRCTLPICLTQIDVARVVEVAQTLETGARV
jgi:ADP-heptose:LPS heptosyltransferase